MNILTRNHELQTLMKMMMMQLKKWEALFRKEKNSTQETAINLIIFKTLHFY